MTVLIMAAVQVGGLMAENMAGRDVRFVPLLFLFSAGPIAVCPYILKKAGMFNFDGLRKKIASVKQVANRLHDKRKHSKK